MYLNANVGVIGIDISTRKHKEKTISRHFRFEKEENTLKKFQCKCGKKYTGRQGLWKHRKICNLSDDDDEKETKISSEELFITLIKDNQ